MQQTSLDRWLRKKYVYVTHVYCNTLPQKIPYGVKVEETNEEAGGMYLYRFLVPNEKLLNELTARLEVANITYTSRVADGNSGKDKMFNNPHKSFTMQIVWAIVILSIVAIIVSGIPARIWEKYSAVEEKPDKKKRAQIEQVERGALPA